MFSGIFSGNIWFQLLIVFAVSIIQALLSTIFSILLALPVAHFFYRYDFFCRRFFIVMASVVSIMPTKLVCVCVEAFFGPSMASGFLGIFLSHLMINTAFAFYVINSAYKKFDITLLWMAKEAGASHWRCYKDVVLRYLRPTIYSMFLLLFILHFTSFSVPVVFAKNFYHNTPEVFLFNFYKNGDNLLANIVWIFRLIVIFPVFFFHNKYEKKRIKVSRYCPVEKTKEKFSIANFFSAKKLLGKGFYVYILSIFLAFVLVFGPLIALMIRTFFNKQVFVFLGSIFLYHVDKFLGVSVATILFNSLLLAFLSAFFSVFLAIFVCVLEFRLEEKEKIFGSKIFYKNLISLFSLLPFIIGAVGAGIIFAYLHNIFAFWPFLLGVFSHVFLNYVFAYRMVRAQIDIYHSDFTKTAQTLGVSYLRAIKTVALPFVMPAVFKAFCLCVGLSLAEVGAGAVLVGKIGITIPTAIKIYREIGFESGVLGLSFILMFFVFIIGFIFYRHD